MLKFSEYRKVNEAAAMPPPATAPSTDPRIQRLETEIDKFIMQLKAELLAGSGMQRGMWDRVKNWFSNRFHGTYGQKNPYLWQNKLGDLGSTAAEGYMPLEVYLDLQEMTLQVEADLPAGTEKLAIVKKIDNWGKMFKDRLVTLFSKAIGKLPSEPEAEAGTPGATTPAAPAAPGTAPGATETAPEEAPETASPADAKFQKLIKWYKKLPKFKDWSSEEQTEVLDRIKDWWDRNESWHSMPAEQLEKYWFAWFKPVGKPLGKPLVSPETDEPPTGEPLIPHTGEPPMAASDTEGPENIEDIPETPSEETPETPPEEPKGREDVNTSDKHKRMASIQKGKITRRINAAIKKNPEHEELLNHLKKQLNSNDAREIQNAKEVLDDYLAGLDNDEVPDLGGELPDLSHTMIAGLKIHERVSYYKQLLNEQNVKTYRPVPNRRKLEQMTAPEKIDYYKKLLSFSS